MHQVCLLFLSCQLFQCHFLSAHTVVLLNFTEPVYQVPESDGFVMICVEAIGNLDRDVIIELTTEDASAFSKR